MHVWSSRGCLVKPWPESRQSLEGRCGGGRVLGRGPVEGGPRQGVWERGGSVDWGPAEEMKKSKIKKKMKKDTNIVQKSNKQKFKKNKEKQKSKNENLKKTTKNKNEY